MGHNSIQVRAPNLSQYSMPTYASGARSEMIPGSENSRSTSYELNVGKQRLNKYLLRRKALSEKNCSKSLTYRKYNERTRISTRSR